MKKAVILFVIAFFAFAEAEAQCRRDTIIRYTRNNVTSQLDLSERTINTFDSGGNITEELRQEWDEIAFVFINNYKTTKTFNAQNRVLTSLDENYSSGVWTGLVRRFYTYLNDTLEVSVISEFPNGSGGWRLSSKDSTAYNSALNEVYTVRRGYDALGTLYYGNRSFTSYLSGDSVFTKVYQRLDVPSTSWLNTQKDSTWESKKQKVRSFHNFIWNATISKWDNDKYYVYNFDNNGNGILSNSYEWNTIASAWKLTVQLSVVYTANNLIAAYIVNAPNAVTGVLETVVDLQYTFDGNGRKVTGVNKRLVGGILKEVERQYFSYDAYGNLIIERFNRWNQTLGIWENSSLYEYTFNSSGFLIAKAVMQDWISSMGIYDNDYREEYKCANANVGINDLTENNLKIYPNPTNGTLNISSEKESIAYLSDLQGRAIETLSISKGENHFEISNLNNGVYFLKIDNNVQRIIKQ